MSSILKCGPTPAPMPNNTPFNGSLSVILWFSPPRAKMEMAIPVRVTSIANQERHDIDSPNISQPAMPAMGGARVMKS